MLISEENTESQGGMSNEWFCKQAPPGDFYNQCHPQKVTVFAIVKDKSSPNGSAFQDSMMNSTPRNVRTKTES